LLSAHCGNGPSVPAKAGKDRPRCLRHDEVAPATAVRGSVTSYLRPKGSAIRRTSAWPGVGNAKSALAGQFDLESNSRLRGSSVCACPMVSAIARPVANAKPSRSRCALVQVLRNYRKFVRLKELEPRPKLVRSRCLVLRRRPTRRRSATVDVTGVFAAHPGASHIFYGVGGFRVH
jgi:hypothetical protein